MSKLVLCERNTAFRGECERHSNNQFALNYEAVITGKMYEADKLKNQGFWQFEFFKLIFIFNLYL